VPRVVCEEKHMGWQAVVIVCRDEDAARRRFGVVGEGIGICYTRTGRRFFDDVKIEKEFLERVRDGVGGAGFWQQFQTDVEQALLNGRSPLLLTSRTEHLDYLAGRLRGMCQHVFVLKGGMGTKQRKQIAESLSHIGLHEPRIILATGSYLGEGFDDARLDTLFLTMPISWRGTLQQYVGRLHRLHENKREVLVYDYADVLVPMLARMYKKRLAGYSALGYIVEGGPPA
jgi:PNKP adenylyltransferase domain, ligase domain